MTKPLEGSASRSGQPGPLSLVISNSKPGGMKRSAGSGVPDFWGAGAAATAPSRAREARSDFMVEDRVR